MNHATYLRPFFYAATSMAIAILAACSKQPEQPPAPTYSPKYVASQRYKGNDLPFQEVATACEREVTAANSCEGKASQWYGPQATDKRMTPERRACLQEMQRLPSCKLLQESGDILTTITAQRVTGEESGRKVWGKNFIELEN